MLANWLLLLTLFAPAVPQETTPPAQEEQPATQEGSGDQGFRIGVAVNQVFLSVNARSVTGGFVKDLGRDDFLVYEDGILQKIQNFYSEKVPVKVVLLIDASGSTRHNQGEIRRAALEFVKRLDAEDQVAIITFNHLPKLVLNWTNELPRIENALESIYARGNTVLNDAIYVTFDDLLEDVDGKKAVILLTDGIDTGSMVGFDEAKELALRSEAMLYVVSKLEEYWADAIAYRLQLQAHGQLVPKELSDDYILLMKRSLNSLALNTGGKVLDTKTFASLIDVYAQVAEELKNQYYISYVPTNIAKDGSWRNVDVQVNRGGIVVGTRRGYYAQ